VLLEKQLWMSVIAKIVLPTTDIAWSHLRFLFNVAVHLTFCSAKTLFFHRCIIFIAGLVTVVGLSI